MSHKPCQNGSYMSSTQKQINLLSPIPKYLTHNKAGAHIRIINIIWIEHDNLFASYYLSDKHITNVECRKGVGNLLNYFNKVFSMHNRTVQNVTKRHQWKLINCICGLETFMISLQTMSYYVKKETQQVAWYLGFYF